MADILRIKRRISGAPGAPASLANAEIAYNEVDHTLYYGEGTGGAGGTATVVVPIGGSGLASNATPLMDGTAAPGASAAWSPRLSSGEEHHGECRAEDSETRREQRLVQLAQRG